MKRDHAFIPTRLYGRLLLLLVALAAMLAPSMLHAGGCMDGKLTVDIKYLWNDSKLNILKKVELIYHAVLDSSVTARVVCEQASESSTDLKCTITPLHAYVYYISGRDQAIIKNPGMFWGSNNVPEKICTDLDLAVYSLATRKKVY